MKDLNRIFLMGRLGGDPEQIETKSGIALVRFSLATTHRVRSDDGGEDSFRNETQWHRVITWGKVAENCAKYLKKGQTVTIDGAVRNRKYLGKDKTFRMAFEIHAENVHFGGSKRNGKNDFDTHCRPEAWETHQNAQGANDQESNGHGDPESSGLSRDTFQSGDIDLPSAKLEESTSSA